MSNVIIAWDELGDRPVGAFSNWLDALKYEKSLDESVVEFCNFYTVSGLKRIFYMWWYNLKIK